MCLCFGRVHRVLWSLPYYGQLHPPVRQHGRARRLIRLSRTLRNPSYVHAPIFAFARPTVSLSTRTDIERLYGERKPIPPSTVQYLQRAADTQHTGSSSATSISSAGIFEGTTTDPDGPGFDRMSNLSTLAAWAMSILGWTPPGGRLK